MITLKYPKLRQLVKNYDETTTKINIRKNIIEKIDYIFDDDDEELKIVFPNKEFIYIDKSHERQVLVAIKKIYIEELEREKSKLEKIEEILGKCEDLV